MSEPAGSAPARPTSPTPSELRPLDETLLERANTQWQFGDWEGLAEIELEALHHHPDRAKLALLAAEGHLQLGQVPEARALLKEAQGWGVAPKTVHRVLIAGVYNTLGKASFLKGQVNQAMDHFATSVRIAMPGTEHRLSTKARALQQVEQLVAAAPDAHEFALGSREFAEALLPKAFHERHPRGPHLVVQTLAEFDLGPAWAGNTINTVIFRHHGLLTRAAQQYTAFYADEHTLRLVQRDLLTNELKTHDLPGDYNLRDAHNSISLGIDRKGHLHLSYDHHVTQLRYRRSLNPGDIGAWSEELPMTGTDEEKVTYPTFILPRHEFPLTFLYRDGSSEKGAVRMKTYDEATETWTPHPQAILSGSEQKPWTSNPYWNHPAIGSDGSLHLSFVWRTHSLGEAKRVNNINIGYAWSHDNGLTWKTSQNRPYRLPITQVNAETIHPVSPGSNLINQTSMALDSHNRPHIAFYADDPDGIPQYQHLWFDGKVWRHQVVSQRSHAFSLEGSGTLQIPISRPEIVIDRDDHVYIITRGDHTGGRLAACRLGAPDYGYQHSSTEVLLDEDLGFAEPVIDRERWQQEKVLSVLLQFNEQPDHDEGHSEVQHTVRLVDVRFS